MAPKPKAHNWNDVQTAIATVTIVTTLGLWNLFATPVKASVSQVVPTTTTVPPTEPPAATQPPVMPQIKIMFTDMPQQTVTNPQPQTNTNTTVKKKKKNNNTSSGGSVTTTKTS